MHWLDRLRGLTVSGSLTLRFDLIPDAPALRSVTFTRGNGSMAKGHASFDTPADAGVARNFYLVLNGGAEVSIAVPDGAVAVDFDCNSGDTYSASSDDTNVTGTGPRSPAISGTVPSFPPPAPPLPGAPPLSSITFTAS